MGLPAVAEFFAEDDVIPREVHSDLDWVRAVQSGLPASAVDAVMDDLGFSMAEVERLVMPRRTIAHRRAHGQPLTRDESDRLARLARVALAARETFGGQSKAHEWLRRANRALAGVAPIDLLDTDDGARLVEQVLGRLAHGLFS